MYIMCILIVAYEFVSVKRDLMHVFSRFQILEVLNVLYTLLLMH